MAEEFEGSKKRYKSRIEHKNSLMSYFKNKRKTISDNIYKCKKDITQELKDYKKKNDFNITFYKEQSRSSKDFKRIYSIISKNQKEKKKNLINNLLNDYLLKKNMKVDKQEMKENIFELCSLIEPNLTKLEMDYIFNYGRIKNEIKENELLNDKIDEFRRTMYPNKRKGNYFINKIPIRNKLLNEINCLSDVKFMKKMNIMTKSKMIDNDLIKEEFIIRKIKHQLKESKKKGKIEDILNFKKNLKKSLIDIEKLQKQIKIYEDYEKNKIMNNLVSKTTRDDKSKSLFYIPTIVKEFPELLYDKLNKNKDISNRTKNNATNDSTSRTLLKKKEKEKPNTERINYRKKSNDDNSINKMKNNIIENINKEISRKIKFKKKIMIKKNCLNKTMKNFNNREESMSEIAKVYYRLLKMPSYDKNSKENETFMKTFLKERNNLYIDSINEKRPKNYFNCLKNIHSQFSTDRKTQILYDASNLLENKKSSKLINELSNFRNTLRQNENLLIKSLLIEKE